MRTIFPLLVFSAFCPACVQECCQFTCHPGNEDGELIGSCDYRNVCNVEDCRQVVEDECGKPASEKRWRKLDDPFEDVDWDVYAPWDISDGRCFGAEQVDGFCIEGS